jgi:nitroimidazol reductase NimA-like FMN-containing flavoprotein (pyridoxamine 5'-phosphate oxidase superfamily)
MAVITTLEDRPHLVLDEAECLRLLGTRGVGRLGFSDHALPAILPLPYAVHEGDVIIPVRRGSDVADATRGSVVVFAVDCYDASVRSGWAVTVVGPARVVSAPEQVAALDELHARTRPATIEHCYILIRMGLVRGWRTDRPADGSRGQVAADT